MRLEHLTWPKVQAYFQENDTVLIAIGSIECHGRHMPVGTDTMIPNHLLERIEERSDVLIASTIPYGVSPSLAPYPGTIDVDAEVFYQFCLQVFESLYRHGARRFVVLNGHGGNVKTIERLGLALEKKGCLLAMLNWWLMAWDMDPAWKGSEIGGELELFDVTDRIKATGFRSASYRGVTVEIIRSTPRVTDSGWIGPDHPNTATVEWGQRMLQTVADYIADFMEEFKKAELQSKRGE